MGGGRTGAQQGPSLDELEQRRRLKLIRQNQPGRGSTILTSGLGDLSSDAQTLLGR